MLQAHKRTLHGRVVYNRRIHYFTWKRVRSIVEVLANVKGMVYPDDIEEVADDDVREQKKILHILIEEAGQKESLIGTALKKNLQAYTSFLKTLKIPNFVIRLIEIGAEHDIEALSEMEKDFFLKEAAKKAVKEAVDDAVEDALEESKESTTPEQYLLVEHWEWDQLHDDITLLQDRVDQLVKLVETLQERKDNAQ